MLTEAGSVDRLSFVVVGVRRLGWEGKYLVRLISIYPIAADNPKTTVIEVPRAHAAANSPALRRPLTILPILNSVGPSTTDASTDEPNASQNTQSQPIAMPGKPSGIVMRLNLVKYEVPMSLAALQRLLVPDGKARMIGKTENESVAATRVMITLPRLYRSQLMGEAVGEIEWTRWLMYPA
jgi:hypothetical protein